MSKLAVILGSTRQNRQDELNIPFVDKDIDEKLTQRLQKLLSNFSHE